MTELFQQVIAWVSLHPYWAGLVIFSVAMAESLAIVGLIVPGVVIMFGIGALIGSGSIAFWPAMSWAVAGAVAGDGLSFWLGYRYRQRLTAMWPFTRYPRSLAQGIEFFDKYGGKSVAFGRFFGPVRAMIPLVAGMMGMRPWRFFVANLLSALAWAPAYLLPGVVFGASLELASEVALRLVILILLLAGSVWLAVWLVHRVFLLLHPHARSLVEAILNWGRQHPRTGEIAVALTDPAHPEAKGLSILASVLILATGLFVLVLGWVLGGVPHQGLDALVLEGLQGLRTPWADHLMVTVTALADLEVLAPLFFLVLLLLMARGHRHAAMYWLAAAAFCLLASPLLKLGLRIPRPDIVAQAADSFSFPSGHTLRATVMYGFLSVLLARASTPRWRWIPYGLAALLTVAVALSRLYLGVHWLSDIVGSITLGLAWVSALGIAYHRHTAAEHAPWRLAGGALAALVLAMAITGPLLHEHRLDRYDPRPVATEMRANHWWREGWAGLPNERLDARQTQNHPLNVQYAGPPGQLSADLEQTGWRPAPTLNWGNLLKLLSPSLPLQQLPVLPQVHDGQHESLTLEKPLDGDRRLVLRLWPTQIRLTPGALPLWIGLVAEQRQERVAGLLTYAATAGNFAEALQLLKADTGQFAQGRVAIDSGVLRLRPAPVPGRPIPPSARSTDG